MASIFQHVVIAMVVMVLVSSVSAKSSERDQRERKKNEVLAQIMALKQNSGEGDPVDHVPFAISLCACMYSK